ncbi:MAG: phage major tail tube protein [Rhodospirillaceae bacterium]|nr:phage major tail tube protein [Rhodospirillales bacterium]
MSLPKVIKSWNLFIEGRGYAGVAEKTKLPKLEKEMEAWRAAGMLGAIKLDLGMKELEMEFTLGEFNADVLAMWGLNDASGIGARFLAAAVAEDGGGTDAIEISVRGRWESLDFGDVEGKKMSKLDVKMPLTYYRYNRNGTTLIELDMISGKEIVNGVDRSAERLKAIGITA